MGKSDGLKTSVCRERMNADGTRGGCFYGDIPSSATSQEGNKTKPEYRNLNPNPSLEPEPLFLRSRYEERFNRTSLGFGQNILIPMLI